jgi:hypothetical protein
MRNATLDHGPGAAPVLRTDIPVRMAKASVRKADAPPGLMRVGALFGGVGLVTAKEPPQVCSWWLTAARADFSARCRSEWLARMRGSRAEGLVGHMASYAADRFEVRVARAHGGRWGSTSHDA